MEEKIRKLSKEEKEAELRKELKDELVIYNKIKSIDSKIVNTIRLLFIIGIIWIIGWTIAWAITGEYLSIGLLGFSPLALGLLGLINCIEDITAKPPHVALVVHNKKRISVTKGEGFRVFFKRFPVFYDYFLINIEKKNQDLPTETVRTPDLGLLKVPISITWTPGAPTMDMPDDIYSVLNGSYLINYINHGEDEGEKNNSEKKGVRSILADIVKERVREWAMSPMEGPQTYIHAL